MYGTTAVCIYLHSTDCPTSVYRGIFRHFPRLQKSTRKIACCSKSRTRISIVGRPDQFQLARFSPWIAGLVVEYF